MCDMCAITGHVPFGSYCTQVLAYPSCLLVYDSTSLADGAAYLLNVHFTQGMLLD